MAAERVLEMSYTVWNVPSPPTGFGASGAAVVNLAASQTQAERARPAGDGCSNLIFQSDPYFLAFLRSETVSAADSTNGKGRHKEDSLAIGSVAPVLQLHFPPE